MAYREVTMLEVKEVLRLWLGGVRKKRIARQLGLNIKTVRRYLSAAQAHGLAFSAVKVISDEVGFPMPSMERFTGKDGEFRTASFAWYGALRPWLWGTMIRLAQSSTKAARALCEHLHKSVNRTRTDELSIPHAAMKDIVR